jgi:hypothetical protein
MYRDLFEIITPGWMYLMAALFWLFGTDIDTARIGMAVLHCGTIVLIGLTCRRMGVRVCVAWVTALAYLALCQSAWPIASQHWLSTLLCVAVLFVLSTEDRTRGRWVLAGILLGCLIGVQQQRGVIMAIGMAAWCVLAGWLTVRPLGGAGVQRWRSDAAAGLLSLLLGVAVIVVPLLLFVVAAAGVAPVWRALVVHPIVNYGGQTHCPWGYVGLLTLEYSRTTVVPILVWLPAVLLLTFARCVAGMVRQETTAPLHNLSLLVVAGAFSIASIAYFPDFIHIAFIAPLMLIAAAENAEWLLQRAPGPAVIGRVAGVLLAVATTFGCVAKLRQNAALLHQIYPHVHETAFGRVAMQTPRDVELYDEIDTLLDTVPGRELYAYPIVAHWYLLANATNPTRYGFFIASYNAPDQVREVLDVLAAKRLPYIVSLPLDLIKDDPVMAYMSREYEPLSANAPPGYRVYRRREASSPDRRGVS